MTVVRSILPFALAALAETGEAWLVWQGVREHRGLAFVGPRFRPDPAAYGGVFVAGSLAWGMVMDGFRPDGYDLAGAAMCLAGVAVIMWAPRDG